MRALLLILLLGGCPTPTSGKIDLGLTTAPGATLLDAVTRLRVTLTNPRFVTEALRTDQGFKLSIDVEANGEPGALVVEGFDAGGGLVAVGQSPEFGVAAINARIVVYMAVPNSIARAPVSLLPARSNVSGGVLPYGVLFAGGSDDASAPSDAVAIYNAYDHSLVGGKPLPAPRDGIVVAPGSTGAMFMFGGRDANAVATGTFWAFDTNAAAPGVYFDLGDHPAFARADEVAFSIGVDKFVITGDLPIEASELSVATRANVAALAPAAASLVAASGARTAIAIDVTGSIVRFRDNAFDMLATTPRIGGGVGVLPDARFVVAGGGSAAEQNDLLVIDAGAGTASAMIDALPSPHVDASIAVTRRHVVVVERGAPAPVDVLDVATFAALPTTELLAGEAYALPNDQVLIVDDRSGELWLFTPMPPGV